VLNGGANVNARGDGSQTPLHLAVNAEVASLLIRKGAALEAQDHYGRTPLYWAAGAGRRDVVECLLANGAKATPPETLPKNRMRWMIDLSGSPTDDKAACDPLARATEQGYDDIAELLRAHLRQLRGTNDAVPDGSRMCRDFGRGMREPTLQWIAP